MSFSVIIFKNLLRRKLRSTLTALGITVACAAAISLIGFARGLEESSVEVYETHGIDLVVLRSGVSERLTSNLDEGIATVLAALPGVAAVNPSLTDLVSFGEGSLIGIPVHGWPPDGFASQSLHITSGERIKAEDRDAVMLGEGLATSLKKAPGDSVTIEDRTFRVVGIYQGANLFENSTAMTRLVDLQELMDRAHQVTEFQVRLDAGVPAQHERLEKLRKTIAELKNAGGKRLGLAAIPTVEYITGSTEVQLAHSMADVTTVLAVLIGSIGMLNTMMMSVFERTREIGTLRAIGWRRTRILRLILGESLVLSVVGAGLGAALAWILMQALSHAPAVQGLIHPAMSPYVWVQATVLALAVGLVGGLYPAYCGTRLAPAEALRCE
jgi:putative ABC transport system permease protein